MILFSIYLVIVVKERKTPTRCLLLDFNKKAKNFLYFIVFFFLNICINKTKKRGKA